jgi:hypothetical protein
MIPREGKKNLNVVASIVTVFSTLLTAIYGSGGFAYGIYQLDYS